MKVPFTSTQTHQSSNLKLQNHRRNTTFNGSNNTNYEPKSVLDLRRSPSPSPVVAGDKPAPKSEIDALLQSDDGAIQWEDHVLNHLEDWDSLMRELGLHDDSTRSNPQFNHSEGQFPVVPEFPISHSFDSSHTQFLPTDFSLSANQIPTHDLNSFDFGYEFHHMNNSNNDGGFNFVDDLIRAADCFESNELQLAHVILARLNPQLRFPAGKPLQRAAFYFKEALQSLLTGSTRPTRPSHSSDVVQAIKAYKNFANVSPIIMFSNFTANQAILEAIDGSMFVHVVDFDIGFGGQWASFMKEIADRGKANTPFLRITAVVSEEFAIESRLIRENLNQFACDLQMGFEIEFVFVRTFELLSFKAIKFMEGEKTAVLLSPAIIQKIGGGFLGDLRRISPHVVVLVDADGTTEGGTPSFGRSVIDGLEFYSTVLESLEAASGVGGGGEDWIRRIETFLLRPKIFAAVEAAGRRAPAWREAFAAAGLRAVGLSQFANFQAECLLSKVQVRGFQVAKRQAEMVLCWQQRALVATSAWRC